MNRRLVSPCLLIALLMLGNRAGAADRIDLTAAPNRTDTTRVTVELSAGGHNRVKSDDKQSDATEQQLPMSASGKLVYHERQLQSPSSATPEEGTILAVRSYDLAEATLKVDKSGRAPKLPEDRRLIVLASGIQNPILYCADAPLTREQLDLIDVVGNTYLLDSLLPNKPVAQGDTWKHDAALIAPLLTLDSLAVCEVESVLEEYNQSFAKIRLAGTVHGMTDGAATEQEVRGVYLVDRKQGRVTRLNLAIREKRSIGGATPGLDAVAKLQILVEQVATPSQLADAAIAKIRTTRAPNSKLIFEAAPLGFRFYNDRQWFITSEQRESLTLRRVDNGDLVAQCTLTSLPPKSAGRQVSLEQFLKDVEFSLGKNFGEHVSSRQWQNAAGLYCYELVARGIVEEVPVEWHYYLIAPESGHRVSVAVTIEKPMIDRVGQADRQLVESIELFPRMPAAQTAGREGQNPSR